MTHREQFEKEAEFIMEAALEMVDIIEDKARVKARALEAEEGLVHHIRWIRHQVEELVAELDGVLAEPDED